MNKVVYISGPMTGMKNLNKLAFFEAETRLQAAGFSVMNPAKLPDGLSYNQYMQIDMVMLGQCSAIYMLKGHENSKGALAELQYARSVGFEEYHETEGDFIDPAVEFSAYVVATNGQETYEYSTELKAG